MFIIHIYIYIYISKKRCGLLAGAAASRASRSSQRTGTTRRRQLL